ncbi:unnamed protein product [Oncorhynchus mykiss]|uniref:long-chain-fatty-acid--CoA ligase n=1 Tax=Oncorhynchus mykiss TaxID=8022 RepID=A0A060YFS1_ONCMY|nr:unnamed protein product [Oncorhynchus mykiss]
MFFSLGWVTALVAGIFALHVVQKLCFPYFWKDVFYLVKVIRYGARLEIFKMTSKVVTIIDRFVQQVERIPTKPFLIYEGVTYTYQDINERSNKLANVFLEQGMLKKGDSVALLMNNEPDFICVWFGLIKLGCAVAFLNTNIKSRSLLHCFNCCGAKTLVVGAELQHSRRSVIPPSSLTSLNSVVKQGCSSKCACVYSPLNSTKSYWCYEFYLHTHSPVVVVMLVDGRVGVVAGLPKAAVITHLQSLKAAAGFWAYGGSEDDVVYIPLPLYHSAASLIGVGGTIEMGKTAAVYLSIGCETGLLLSKIGASSPFFGYAGSKQLTEKKLMRNVFVKGDVYFNTGDLMAEDAEDFICFKDRVGDTFRWKGENVATTEVTEVLGMVDFIQEANVYGVEIPGNEGRAGMAAIIVRPECEFSGKKLFDHVLNDLPGYARPLFIRLQESMEMTGTFKQQKFNLVESGFNPSTICSPLYFLDFSEKSYVPLTNTLYGSILAGERKL